MSHSATQESNRLFIHGKRTWHVFATATHIYLIDCFYYSMMMMMTRIRSECELIYC